MISTEVTDQVEERNPIPRKKANDYSHEMAAQRREFIRQQTGVNLSQTAHYSFDPEILAGNIENFIGVAQVPIGLAGPLRINGEHAEGDFYIPLATTEGSLVASYNRGMRLLTESGGVKTTVIDYGMQRAPVFVFSDALRARDFGDWVAQHLDEIRREAEGTSQFGKLRNIGQFAVGPLRYLRFNYSTGDAAGHNLVIKATYAACEWIKKNYPWPLKYFLSGNIDTDNKHSYINTLLTRGKRVVAEAVIHRETLLRVAHLDSHELSYARQVQMVGASLAGSSNNSAHSANGLAALFIATGQDVANIAESQAAITYSQQLDHEDYYWSITLPSLIVGTHGGGTALPTQKQCLEVLGCYGAGKVMAFAEICAAVVLAGEISLAAAMLNGEWASARTSHARPQIVSRT